MSQLFDYEKCNNKLLSQLTRPDNQQILKLIFNKNGTILMPHSASIDHITINTPFLLTHTIFKNKENANEFVTSNGLFGLIEMIDDVGTVYILTEKQKIKGTPVQELFLHFRNIYNSFANNKIKSLFSAKILRMGDVMLENKSVNVVLISDPIMYRNCDWSPEKLEALKMGAQALNKPKENKSRLMRLFSFKSNQNESLPPPKSFRDLFDRKLRDPSSENIIKKMKELVDVIVKSLPEQDRCTMVRNGIDNIYDQILIHPLWKDATQQELDVVEELLEKYIMLKISHCCFGTDKEDTEKDQALNNKMEILEKHLKPIHLDIEDSIIDEKKLRTALKELRNINNTNIPKGKIDTILNCCKTIYAMLNTKGKGNVAGADDFLPLLIYITIKANPKNLYSNIKYIYEYRSPSKLTSECKYYMSQLESCLPFIESLTSEQLNISSEEFKEWFSETAKTETPENIQKTNISDDRDKASDIENGSITDQNSESSSSQKSTVFIPSFSTMFLNARSSKSEGEEPRNIESDQTSSMESFFSSYSELQNIEMDLATKRFLNCNPEDIRIGEVPMLLNIFKKLVSENEILKEELKRYQELSFN